MKALLLGFIVLAGVASAADLAPLKIVSGNLADSTGRTVYIFDKDTDGVSNCYGSCAVTWPPVLAPEGEVKAPISVVIRKDKSRQLAYKGSPVYLYIDDERPGDTDGDGIGGIWHLVRPK